MTLVQEDVILEVSVRFSWVIKYIAVTDFDESGWVQK